MHDIQTIYSQLQEMIPGLALQLASGGLPDCFGAGSSDVDIVVFHENHDQLMRLMPQGTKQIINDLKPRTLYEIPGFSRKVTIYATSNQNLITQSTTHRKHELALLQFPMLTAQAIGFKQQGCHTEKARCLALGLQGDPFKQMMRNDILDIANTRETQLAHYIHNLKMTLKSNN